MRGKSSCNIKSLVLSLLIFAGFSSPLFSQKKINGIINQYGRVIEVGSDYVVLDNATQFNLFNAGDTILLIQMKGIRFYVLEGTSFGTSSNAYGSPGRHEFLVIQSKQSLNKIVFSKVIKSGFDVIGDVQIVKVPSYNRAVVNSVLTCQPWDSVSKTGGVLALISKRTLSLDANIDVTGKGLLGGAAANGMNTCSATDVKWQEYAYSALSDSAGFKGEGLGSIGELSALPYVSLFPAYGKGYGKNFNGGGGGNGLSSGGGGGANYGKGGFGGPEKGTCSNPTSYRGLGGYEITYLTSGLDGGLFIGGGGGGSTSNGGTAIAGGSGGGIVILVCDTIKGKGRSILANGGTPVGTAVGDAGAGGGGAGGSIAIYLESYSTRIDSSALNIYANGGKGGNNASFGEGGGGGGGYVTTNNISSPFGNVIRKADPGNAGTRTNFLLPLATIGTAGKNNIITFSPVLNGFLFNSIRSSVTGSEIDSVCSNLLPPLLTGTSPAGGTTPYTYLWESSVTSDLTGFSTAPGVNNLPSYMPPDSIQQTTWFRRIITDAGGLTDISKPVKIVVQQSIRWNKIGSDTTICNGQNPLKLRHIGTPAGGYGNLHYHWLQNTTNIWTAYARAEGTDSTKADFDPSALTVTTYYKRKINAGHCNDYSNTVAITVLPSISNNLLNSHDSIICEGFLFDSLRLKKPAGGSSSYLYQWQDRKTLTAWINIASATNKAYFPDTSKFNDTDSVRYFRRIVYSGMNNTCVDTSLNVRLTRFPWITNNVITSPDTTICSAKTPYVRKGTGFTGGDGTPHWQWEQSINSGGSWTNAAGTGTNQNYSPPALTTETWYRRKVTSSVCKNTSTAKKVFIDPVITNFTIAPDTTICNSTAIFKIRGKAPGGGTGAYGFVWKKSLDDINFPVIGGATLREYTPAASHTQSTSYRRIVTSGACKDSSQVKLNVLNIIGGNIIQPDKPDVCFNSVPGTLIQTGGGLTGGAGAGSYTYLWQDSTATGTWLPASGTNTSATYTPIDQLIKTKWFRRKVISGPANCCFNFSAAVQVDTMTLPTGDIPAASNPDTTICGGGDAKIRLKLTGYKPWKVTYDGDATGVVLTGINDPNYRIIKKPTATAAFSSFLFKYAAVEDKNGCLATSKTGSRKVDIYRVPNTNAGPDDAVCGPAFKLAAIPSDGIGTWTWEAAAQVVAPFPAAYNSTVYIDSSYTVPYKKYKFYWAELNGICPSKDSVYITFNNRIDTISAGADTSIMTFDNITKVVAYPKLTFEKGKWSVVAGSGSFVNDTLNSTYVKNISLGLNTYKWSITNGKCLLESLVSFNVSKPVIPQGLSPNGDGINDSLIISGIDTTYQEIELTILNGAGVPVFTASYGNGKPVKVWDGKNSKGAELPEGTYYYLLKVFSTGTRHVSQEKGFIILKRN